MDDLEKRIRERIKKHHDFVLGLTTELSTSCSKFASSLKQAIHEIEGGTATAVVPPFVKLAAIDVDFRSVHALLLDVSKRSETLSSFLDTILENNSCDQVFSPDSSSALAQKLRFVLQTHVTLAHSASVAQTEITAKFLPLVGCRVLVSVAAVLWNSVAMALEVEVAANTDDGKALPPSENRFVHITVWFQTGAKALSSNELPDLFRRGLAERVHFDSLVSLNGCVSLWKQ